MSGAIFLSHLVILCLVVAIGCSFIRTRDWRVSAREARHFFGWMVVGIVAVSAVVFLVDWTVSRMM